MKVPVVAMRAIKGYYVAMNKSMLYMRRGNSVLIMELCPDIPELFFRRTYPDYNVYPVTSDYESVIFMLMSLYSISEDDPVLMQLRSVSRRYVAFVSELKSVIDTLHHSSTQAHINSVLRELTKLCERYSCSHHQSSQCHYLPQLQYMVMRHMDYKTYYAYL